MSFLESLKIHVKKSKSKTLLCEVTYLIQAHHVAESSVVSGEQVLWQKAFLCWGPLSSNLLLWLREISHEPQDDPPHSQGGLGGKTKHRNTTMIS